MSIKMFRIIQLCSLLFGALVSVPATYGTLPSAPFHRAGNSYESIFGNYPGSLPAPEGYPEIIQKVLKKYQNSEASFQDLNKFCYGLDQLFKFKVLQKYNEDELSKHDKKYSYPDHLKVPDYTDESGVSFKYLTVYGFPAFKKCCKVELTHDGMNSGSEYQITGRYPSDTTILTGSFCIGDSEYFFEYNLKSSFLWLNLRKKRDSDELIFVKRALGFDKEEFIHTYDSTCENAIEITAKVKDALTKRLLPHILYELSQQDVPNLNHQIIKKELDFAQKYYKSILTALLQLAKEYVKGKVQANEGSDIFCAEPLAFDLSTPHVHPVEKKITDIKLKGFLNYVGSPEFVHETKSVCDDGRYNMSQGVKFTYAQGGDKQAIVSFVLKIGPKTYLKEFKVQCITVVSTYLADLTKKPPQLYRDKNAFNCNTGFSITVDTYDGDPVYEYVLTHLSTEMIKAIDKAIECSA